VKDRDHLEDVGIDGSVIGKGKCKVHPTTGHEGPEGE
jgi:hypothetical protein